MSDDKKVASDVPPRESTRQRLIHAFTVSKCRERLQRHDTPVTKVTRLRSIGDPRGDVSLTTYNDLFRVIRFYF